MAGDDDDMWAAMGLPVGFGKQTTKKKVDIAARMESTKRTMAKQDVVRTHLFNLSPIASNYIQYVIL